MVCVPQFWVLLFCGSLALAAATKCDDLTPAGGGTGYQKRDNGDRCEGKFEGDRSFRGVILAGFSRGPIAFQPGVSKALTLQWRSKEAVHLRVSSVKKDFFYRMDSDRSTGDSSYRWKLELLAQLEAGSDDVALTAFSGPAGKEIYYPVSSEDSSSGTLRFTFLTTAKDTESLEFSGCNQPEAGPGLAQPIRKPGPFERTERVEFELPARNGRFCLQVVARYSGGGAQTDTFVLQVQ